MKGRELEGTDPGQPAMALFGWVSSLLTIIWRNLTLLGFSLIFFAFAFDFMKRRRNWNHPPGPISLPFIGTMLFLDFNNFHLSLTQLNKKYGNIFSLQNCWENVVVLNGFKTIKEALVYKSEDFADRPSFPFSSLIDFGENNQGLILAKYGQGFKEQRRFALSLLRDFGMGKRSLEQLVIEEAGYLCSAFGAEKGHPFYPRGLLNQAVNNVIRSITFGNRSDYKDEKFQKFLLLISEALKEEIGFLSQIIHVVPFLMYIPGLMEKAFQHQKGFLVYIRDELLMPHKETWDPSCRRDITDAFLEEIENKKDDVNSSFNDQNLTLVISQLFAAGTETTATTLAWGLLFMILYPNVQTKVQEEIDEVVGKNRSPNMEDQANMHYTRAVIHEIQRFGNILPAGIPHMTYRDTELGGFFIPKGTTVITNLTSVLKDETMWENPHQFYPEHFLDKNGHFVKREAFLPFSAGRRACLGEQLARMELFLFFTSLLQHFTFHIPKDQPRPREDGCYNFSLIPHPYQIQAVSRGLH